MFVHDLFDGPSMQKMFDDGIGAKGQMLFHLALRWAAVGPSDERGQIVADIGRSGCLDAVDVALVVAGSDLAAHPDDQVLRRAVLVLDESKRRLAGDPG